MVSPGEKADCGGEGFDDSGAGRGVPGSGSILMGTADCESRVCWLGSSSGGLREESSVGMGVVSERDYATRGSWQECRKRSAEKAWGERPGKMCRNGT